MRIAAILIATFMLGLAIPARADFEQDKKRCNSDTGPDIRIGACTRLIQSGDFKGENLANLFSNRGNVYRIDGQYDRAIQDYDQAINLNPRDAKAFAGRAFANEKTGRLDQALKDYKKAYYLDFRNNYFVKRIRELGARTK